MSSLYAQYVKERLGQGIIETEEGFVTFSFPTEKIVYIVDLYVVPEKRKEGVASKLADEVVKIAKEQGKTQLLGSVDLQSKGSNDSIKVLLAYGMSASHASGNGLYFIKEI